MSNDDGRARAALDRQLQAVRRRGEVRDPARLTDTRVTTRGSLSPVALSVAAAIVSRLAEADGELAPHGNLGHEDGGTS